MYSKIPDSHLLKLDLLADSIIRDNYLHKYSISQVMGILAKQNKRLDRFEESYVLLRISKELKKRSCPSHEQSRFSNYIYGKYI
jgi:hypothetical protein